MQRNKSCRWIQGLMASLAAVALLQPLSAVGGLPTRMALHHGGSIELPASSGFELELSDEKQNAVGIEDRDGSRTLTGRAEGTARLTYSLLGVLPVRSIEVSVKPDRVLIPGGQSIGVAIDTEGVIFIGASDVGKAPSPARVAGLRSGDRIHAVNGQPVGSAEALSGLVTNGEAVKLDVTRNGERIQVEALPVLDERDGRWRLGAWVRDSTAGIGTLTFVDKQTGIYGALGHAITDADTGVVMPVGEGELYDNDVIDIQPSAQGSPGELTGDFVFEGKTIGTVEMNSSRGIYGHIEPGEARSLYPEGLPIAAQREIHAGPATLLATLDGGEAREYACEVVRVGTQNGDKNRCMVIRVTDAELLRRTGGIVQGMSGSPLIQDGRIIGAVTHVMVNDPAMGYGISIEAMLEQAEQLKTDNADERLAA